MPAKGHAFSTRYTGLSNILTLPVKICITGTSDIVYSTNGIIDTGATNSVISKKVVQALKLPPSNYTRVNTASEQNVLAATYIVDIILKDKIRIEGLTVTEGPLMDDLECLLGMDIINMGDLAITNYQGKTVYSFRIPSVQAIDFVEETKKLKEKQFSKTGRNQPCPCGSGKIFKRCCGPKYGKF